MNAMSPSDFVTDAINAANTNLKTVQEEISQEKSGSVDRLMRIAELQAELAKASALVLIAKAITDCSTPGQSIRYGMAEVAAALSKTHS